VYIYLGDQIIATVNTPKPDSSSLTPNNQETINYILPDHLSSTSIITDE